MSSVTGAKIVIAHQPVVYAASRPVRDAYINPFPATGWDEVRTARDSGDPAGLAFEARQVLERVAERGDLFAPALSLVQELPRF